MDTLLDEVAAAQYLSLSRSFLRQARIKGTGPKFLKMGRAVRYQLIDIQDWLESRTRQNTIRR